MTETVLVTIYRHKMYVGKGVIGVDGKCYQREYKCVLPHSLKLFGQLAEAARAIHKSFWVDRRGDHESWFPPVAK